jgi:hypothetical protein
MKKILKNLVELTITNSTNKKNNNKKKLHLTTNKNHNPHTKINTYSHNIQINKYINKII